jgi:hypothetical protein
VEKNTHYLSLHILSSQTGYSIKKTRFPKQINNPFSKKEPFSFLELLNPEQHETCPTPTFLKFFSATKQRLGKKKNSRKKPCSVLQYARSGRSSKIKALKQTRH